MAVRPNLLAQPHPDSTNSHNLETYRLVLDEKQNNFSLFPLSVPFFLVEKESPYVAQDGFKFWI